MTQRSFQILLALGLLFSAGFLVSQSHAAEFPENRRVLVIYGNPDIGPWEQNFNQIILRELSTVSAIPVIPEFLSLIGTSDEEQRVIADSLNLKYSQLEIDLLIAVIPEANTFVHRWHETFAPHAALLYAVPGSDILDNVTPDERNVIIESSVEAASRKTVELIPKVLPTLGHLYIVGGASDGDLSYLERSERAIAESNFDYDYTVLSGLTPDELVARLLTASDDSAILLNPYDRDRTGQPLRTMAINTLLEENIPLPVFGAFDTLLQSGTLGGNMSSSSLYATTTVRKAREILEGTVSEFRVQSDTSYMFDGSKLDRFNIDRSLLPEGSIIIHETPNFLRDYYGWIVGGIAIMVLQLALITLLMETIRRRKAAESELKEAQKMEALGSLAGGIAHDFNNILMSIMANAELAKIKPDEKNDLDKRLTNILSAGERAKDLIAQILMFSRQSAQSELKPLDVCNSVQETVDHIRSFLPESYQLVFNCTPSLPLIKGNQSQLHQVIMNLCINAQHAMKNGGVISISSAQTSVHKSLPVAFDAVPAGDYVIVTISDTGCGMDSETLRHVFKPFYTTKPQGEGTGLGLALVRQIIKGHGGYIGLKSAPGEGTEITLYFPACKNCKDTDSTESRQLLHTGNGEKILLLDDDETVLDATRQTLESLGYEVTPFLSANSALEWFHQNSGEVDLVYSDLSMPEMNGIRFIESIRGIDDKVPAVICSGYWETVDLSPLKNTRKLNKPCSKAEISQVLQSLLKSESPVPA